MRKEKFLEDMSILDSMRFSNEKYRKETARRFDV